MTDKNAETFAAALQALKRGEVIVFPTETFYGLGADALNEAGVERIVSLKGRNPDSPIAVIVAGQEMLAQMVSEVPPVAQKLIDRFWPGPLTLVLPAKEGLPAPLLNRDRKIGVRISSHTVAARLARELGHPLTATSANPSGKEPARTIQEARAYFDDRIEIFLDGGTLTGKAGSTVAEVIEHKLRIIREGKISSEELERWI
ncbi:MAG TPA: L-threonylcarbamoyladenylate synthase [Candidatus Binatia bacterium]|nr:L-threonylcarbamoyladenylate synthase [Candidatus Binatia bacterium]